MLKEGTNHKPVFGYRNNQRTATKESMNLQVYAESGDFDPVS
jgi:hypothetical protein